MDIRRHFKLDKKMSPPPTRSPPRSLPSPEPPSFQQNFSYKDIVLSKQLGSGAFGSIFIAKDERDDKEYALKSYSSKKVVENGFMGSLVAKSALNRQEVDLLQRVHHPNVIKGLGVIVTEEEKGMNVMKVDMNLLMELADMSLYEYLGEDLTNEMKISLCYNVICAVNFIHELGYIHCDIKADNFLISKGVAKLADPGYLIDRHGVGDKVSASSFCNPLLERAPEFIAIFNINRFVVLDKTIKELPLGGEKNVRTWFERYQDYLSSTKFYKDSLDINEVYKIDYVTVESLSKGEIYSLGILLLEIYISPMPITDNIYNWLYINFSLSKLSYSERLAGFKEINTWPKGERNIPEMDELLAMLLCGPDERPTFDEILNSRILRDNNYTNFIKGYIENKITDVEYSCIRIKNVEYLPAIRYMAEYASSRDMFIYNLSKSYALFYRILLYISVSFESLTQREEGQIERQNREGRVRKSKEEMLRKQSLEMKISSAGIMSLFLSIGRNDYTMTKINLPDIYSFFSSRMRTQSYGDFMIMLSDVYQAFNGITSYDCTFEHGSNGNVDYRALRYYTNCDNMIMYTPLRYVVGVENKYIEHVARKRARNEPVKFLPKNTLVSTVYKEILKIFEL